MGDGIDPVSGEGLSSMDHARAGARGPNDLIELCVPHVLCWLDDLRRSATKRSETETSDARAAELLNEASWYGRVAEELRKVQFKNMQKEHPSCPTCGEPEGSGAALNGLLTISKRMIGDFNRGALLIELDWLGFARAIDFAERGEVE